MDEKKLAILLEMVYKDAGMTEAKTSLENLTEAGKKTQESLTQMATGMGSLDTRVNDLYSALEAATPQNIQYAESFLQIQEGLTSGSLSIEEARTKLEELRNEMGLSTQSAQQIQASLNQTAMGMNSLQGNVDSLLSSLQKATPANLEYAATFKQIQEDLQSGAISIDDAKGKLEELKGQMGEAEPPTSSLGGALGGLTTNLIGLAAGFASAKAIAGFIKDVTLAAAQADLLSVVSETLGNNVGLSTIEVRGLENELQSLGLTTMESSSAIAAMIQGNVDLAYATDLTTVAMDAAVIAGMEEGEALEQLTFIIATGNERMARRMGLMVDFQGAYEKEADALGKSVSALTDYEKQQARINEVLSKGATIAGTYEASLNTAAKQVDEFGDNMEELKVALGEVTQVAFFGLIKTANTVVTAMANSAKATNIWREALANGSVEVGMAEDMLYRLQKGLISGTDAMQIMEAQQYASSSAAIESSTSYSEYVVSLSAAQALAEEYGFTLSVLTFQEYESAKGFAASDAAMLAWVENMKIAQGIVPVTIEQNEQYTQVMSRMGDAEKQAAGELDALNKKMEAAAAANKIAAESMTAYFNVFTGAPTDTGAQVLDAITQSVVDQAVATREAGGDISPYLELLDQIDPTAADALRGSEALFQYIETIKLSLATGVDTNVLAENILLTKDNIDLFNDPALVAAGIFDQMNLSLPDLNTATEAFNKAMGEGATPSKAMGEALAAIAIPIPIIEENQRKIAAITAGMLDNWATLGNSTDLLAQYLAETVDPSTSLMNNLATMQAASPYNIEVYVNYHSTGAVPPVPTVDEETEEVEHPPASAMGHPVYGVVPPGHPTDSWSVPMKTGEAYGVWNASQGMPGMGGIAMSFSAPLMVVENVSSDIDMDKAVNSLMRRLEELSRQ